MLAHHAEPALAAAAATGVILAARWAATRPQARRQGAGTDRPPLRRRNAAAPPEVPARRDGEPVTPTAPTPPAAARPAPAHPAPPEATPDESAAVLEAERHVRRCWQLLRAHSDQRDH
ncbi:hypothetical protein [Streptomyces sp. NPDC002328]|uniref:hypothetical protein n=1 Tax=Streptomyces sp. NPDC002328 TaxID=3364642 RepID=UPI0036C54566